jgi:hypothetical protein
MLCIEDWWPLDKTAYTYSQSYMDLSGNPLGCMVFWAVLQPAEKTDIPYKTNRGHPVFYAEHRRPTAATQSSMQSIEDQP